MEPEAGLPDATPPGPLPNYTRAKLFAHCSVLYTIALRHVASKNNYASPCTSRKLSGSLRIKKYVRERAGIKQASPSSILPFNP